MAFYLIFGFGMAWLISKIGIILVSFIGKSLRVKVIGSLLKGSAIYVFWHSDSFPLLYIQRFKNITILVSTHRDGEYMARIAGGLGYKVVRGASKDRGAKGLIELLRVKGGSFALTPDGPRGPSHCVKLGIAKFAEFGKLPIVPVGVYLSNKIRFNSWDRYQLPFPISRCIVCFGKPILIEKADESSCELVKDALIKSNLYAEQVGKLQIR